MKDDPESVESRNYYAKITKTNGELHDELEEFETSIYATGSSCIVTKLLLRITRWAIRKHDGYTEEARIEARKTYE